MRQQLWLLWRPSNQEPLLHVLQKGLSGCHVGGAVFMKIMDSVLWFISSNLVHFVMVYYNWYTFIDTIVKRNNIWYPPIHITYIPSLIIGTNVSLNVVYSIIQPVGRYEDLFLHSKVLNSLCRCTQHPTNKCTTIDATLCLG